MKILGIHYETHDAGAAILENNDLIAAVAEERLSRKKEDGSFPLLAIEEVLILSNLDINDIDVIAVSGEKNAFKSYYYQMMYDLHPLLYSFHKLILSVSILDLIKIVSKNHGLHQIKKGYFKRKSFHKFLKDSIKKGFKGRIVFVPHDKAHAASAYYSSGFDTCLIPIVEGYSFQNASSIWVGKENKLERIKSIPWPHSPGQFYRCVTMLSGFSPRRHAGKITGLAAYGDSSKHEEKVSSLLRYKNGNIFIDPMVYILQYQYQLKPTLPEYFKGATREDLSAAFQKTLEDVVTRITAEAISKSKIDKISLAGGVVANVKVNQRIAALESVSEIHAHPAMSDAGQALGSAVSVALDEGLIDMAKQSTINDVYLGTEIDITDIESILSKENLSYTKPMELPTEVAKLLAKNKVVALCHGRMEYGPRALGNRTIMYSPADSDVNDWLNKNLNRTEFMPFAPVTMSEYIFDCYDNDLLKKVSKAIEFMTVSIDCTEKMKRTQPAVVHVDGTARPQVIFREKNPFYYDILKEFHKITDLPSLVNTSFNMHEEPIVRTAQDAIRSFVESKIDYLVINDYLISAPKN